MLIIILKYIHILNKLLFLYNLIKFDFLLILNNEGNRALKMIRKRKIGKQKKRKKIKRNKKIFHYLYIINLYLFYCCLANQNTERLNGTSPNDRARPRI